MKKNISILALVLVLALSLCVPAMAASEYGVIYDETESLGSQTLTYQGEEMLPALIRTAGMDIRVDVLVGSEYDSVDEAAASIYTKYGYGYGDENKGVTLTIQLEDLGSGSYAMASDDEWGVYAFLGEDSEGSQELADAVRAAVEPYMALRAWNGEDMTMSATALTQAVQAMAEAVSSYGGTEPSETVDDTMRYVFDMSDLLSYDEWRELEDRAADISQRHSCGVYCALVDDFTESGFDDVYEAAYQIYHANELGAGEDRDGIFVLLSMAERDYAMFVYGDSAEYAFNEYGQEQLEGEFLGDFGSDDWYGGISHYLDACDEYLTQAEAGSPVSGGSGGGSEASEPASPAWGMGLMTVLSCMIAGAVCVRLKRKMRTVYPKAEANAYVAAGGLRLTEEYDRYTHTTKTRRKIEKERSSGGGGSTRSRSGGGGSGRSGKF